MTDEPSRDRDAAPDPAHDPDEVLRALRQVVDPEIGLDVVTLGLIYGLEVEDRRARIRYTLTTEGCPMAGVIRAGIVSTAQRIPGIEDVEAELVWEPRWTPEMIEDGAL